MAKSFTFFEEIFVRETFGESLYRETLLIFQFAKVYPVNCEVFSANDFHFFFFIIKTPYFQ